MLFVVNATDKPNSLAIRMATRLEHIAYVQSLGPKIKMGGPFLDEQGEMTGTLLVIEASTRQEVEAVLALDPYVRAGLFDQVDIKAWKWVLHNPDVA